MTTEPRTQREIMAALHMPVPQRNCCTDLLDDGSANSFGPRHLALVIVTFTFSVMCLSIVRSGSASASVKGSSSSGGSGSTSSVVSPMGVPSSSETGSLPLHYLDQELSSVLLLPLSPIRDGVLTLAKVDEIALSVKASVIGLVGAHTPKDTATLLRHLKGRPSEGAGPSYVLSVSEGEEPQSHENLFADSTYFSVISKRTGVEVLSARSERVGAEVSAIRSRLRKTPFDALLLLTGEAVGAAAVQSIPVTTLSRLVLAHEEGSEVVLRRGGSPKSVSKCPMGHARVAAKGKAMTFECLSWAETVASE